MPVVGGSLIPVRYGASRQNAVARFRLSSPGGVGRDCATAHGRFPKNVLDWCAATVHPRRINDAIIEVWMVRPPRRWANHMYTTGGRNSGRPPREGAARDNECPALRQRREMLDCRPGGCKREGDPQFEFALAPVDVVGPHADGKCGRHRSNRGLQLQERVREPGRRDR